MRIPAKFVIHTVGPVYRDGQQITAPCGGSRPMGKRTRRAERVPSEPEKLTACYRNSLALAAENGCKSIAFPCISTGVYGYPIEDAAKIAVREVRRFLSPAETQSCREGEGEKVGSRLSPAESAEEMEVLFCCFSERDMRVYQSIV